MRNYTEEIRAQHDGKIYREVITFTDLDKNGNKIIVELLRGRRGKAEYIAVDVTRLDGEGVYTGAMDLNPQVERHCAVYVDNCKVLSEEQEKKELL